MLLIGKEYQGAVLSWITYVHIPEHRWIKDENMAVSSGSIMTTE